MDLLSQNDLQTLMNKQTGLCISMFMPTRQAGPEIQQDPIRCDNLLKAAEERLVAQGLRSPEAAALLEPIQKLVKDSFFWRHQSDGLALFRSAELFRFFRLPIDFEELVVVTHRFHIKPLLPLFSGNGRFYILAISQNEVKLLQGTRYRVRVIDLRGVPHSLAEALKYDEFESQLQFHTQTPGGPGKRAAIFHGHGVGIDDTKDNILRYCQQVDRGLHDILKDERAPLLFAGVDYLLPIYKSANTYPALMDKGIEGNPERMSEEELHDRAWSLVRPQFERKQREAMAWYRQFAGTGKASNDFRKIIPATAYGQIEVLFFALGFQQWGHFDPDTGSLELHAREEPGDEDLLDFAAVQTLIHRGTVYGLEPDAMPDETHLAAVFRY
jgi:hypothetical protein